MTLRSGLLAASMLVSSLSGNAALGAAPAHAQTAPVIPAPTTINNPPVAPLQILVFPQRDFVSASGYTQDDRVIVSVIHPNGTTFSTDPNTPIVPQDDPRAAPGAPFAGIVEVNHPGGACWFQTTPDIRPGDKVRITIVANAVDGTRVGRADETTVANVTAQRPVQVSANTVQIHGTAVDATTGGPIDPAQLEQRLVANKDIFLFNGRRTLRATSAAGADGTLAYDAPGSTSWTATYTGLQPADVTRALGAESRILWLGANPLAAVEGTIYENGAGVLPGPAAPCTAPLEFIPPPPGSDTTPPTAPSGLTAAVSNSNTVTLNWTAATDNVGVTSYGIYRDGLPIFNVQNPDGSAPAPTSYVDANVPPGTYTYTVDAADALGNRSPVSNAASATTVQQVATLPAGTVVHNPPAAPVQIISFPSRDFVSSSGFLPTDTVLVQVLRKYDTQTAPVVVSTSSVIPQQDPRAALDAPFAGIVEVNHPGGGCWDGVTPDIRTGDTIRTIAYTPDGTVRTVDETTTANVIAERPFVVKSASSATAADGVVQVKGVAMYHDGTPMDLAQVESRLIANRDHFVLNGRRVIRAGGAGKDGTLVYDPADPTGVHWIATYSGLVQQDIDRIMGLNGFPGAESRALWLGSQPLAGLELTIYENSADPLGTGTVNGPSAGVCPAPSEPFDTQPPAFPPAPAQPLTATQSGPNTVQLTWPVVSTPTAPTGGASDNVAVYQYGVYLDGTRIRNLPSTATGYTATNVAPGSHTWTIDAVDAASPSAQLAATPTFSSPWGNRSAPSNTVTLVQRDVTPPSVPQNLVATAGVGQVSLSWSASTDDVGVTSYRVYRNSVAITGPGTANPDVTASTTPTFLDSGLAVASYSYTVDAADAAGNRSAQSAAATANVSAVPDTAAPSVPTGLTAANSPDIHGKDVLLTWAASTDNVGVTGYGVYRNGAKIADVNGSTLSYTDANLVGGTYAYTVDAVDSANNRSAQSATATAVVANDPPLAPHNVIAFPARDFISATGYTPGATYSFSLLRGGTLFTSGQQVADATGTVEVNHPGGTCWNVTTPNMRPGDIIRITDANGVAEQTTVANVTAQRPLVVATSSSGGTVLIHGTAQDALGNPLPVAQVEQRLIANRDAFDLNGRRTLRAGGAGTDGTFTYDPVDPVKNPKGSNWTVRYDFATADDLARAVGGTSSTGTVFVGAESRAVWLGRDPLALTEGTIFENGAGVVGGPAAGTCTAPAETPAAGATFTPTSLDFGSQSAIPASTSAAKTVTFSNGGGAPMTLSAVYLAGLNPGDFAISSTTCPATLAAGASCSVSVTFSPKALGLRQANLSFADDAANTTDQSVTLTGSGIDTSAPSAPTWKPQTVTFPSALTVDQATVANSTLPVTLNWTASTGTVTGYQLQMSKNGGAFADATPQPGTAASATVNLAMGTLDLRTLVANSYQFQVRACNGTNCSAWVVGPKFTPLPIDDGMLSLLSYGGNWTQEALPGAYGGTVRYASTAKDKVALPNKITFTVTGNLAWVSTLGPDRGKASVSIDGGAPVTIDLYSPTKQPAQVVFATNNLKAGVQHSITVQVLGTKNALSTGTRVDLDAIVAIK